jgi:hypothetical protein
VFFKFSIVSMEWTNLDAAAGIKGTGPSARGGHAMSTVGTDLYLFGGDRIAGGQGTPRRMRSGIATQLLARGET